jgi:hypothetical protein
MKKLFVLFAALALVCAMTVPAAAEQDWNFYGSARMTTFYDSYSEDSSPTGESESNLTWAEQGNSRIGANVSGDVISGRFEYGTGINLRLLWGQYDFGAGQLRIGQDYTPVSFWVGSQVYASDAGLIGYGAPYGSRVDQIKLMIAGFQLALIENPQYAFGTNETSMPKLEARYDLKLGDIGIGFFGGYNSYKDIAADESLNSTMYGVGVTGSFGVVSFDVAVHGGTNMANAAWYGSGANAATPGGEDTASMNAAAAVSFKASDAVAIQGGAGYLSDKNDDLGSETDTKMAYYVQLQYTVAPGFTITPEVGIVDMMKDMNDVDQGTLTYFGAKWQMNF